MITLDPRTSALVLVDLMERIVGQELAPYSGGVVVARCAAMASAMRKVGGLVVNVRVERPNVTAQPPGSGFVADARPQEGDLEIVKRTWGAFHNTGLDEELRGRGITTLVIAGIATNFGVEQTARFADEFGYEVIVLECGTTGLDAKAHEFAFEYVFPRLGTVATSAELLAALG
ncbi:isochorismatase family protein [Nonomuraea soli]|uniref:Nicotinamidase-related amidase n=1 Tax=Nonomuraea soli TaxID=1032476 RepID=A0A7W0HTC8_9ACTN|nr:isochorismatase family protein [Nonomuraea soli]MBA2894998.1 nicotinamidase-related amidase [Nonomuraea soli]